MQPTTQQYKRPVLPGEWIGVLGGGQLGRMFVQSAQRLGYHVMVLCPEENCPASQVADATIVADYTDRKALSEFVEKVSAVTIEFENIPSESLAFIAAHVPVRPGEKVLHTTQNRLREKRFLKENGFPVAAFEAVHNLEELQDALRRIKTPCVLKTAGFGYDGKGQFKLNSVDDAPAAIEALNGQPGVLESWVNFVAEYSVIGVRNVIGKFVAYGPVENRHKNHILDVTISPLEPKLSKPQIGSAQSIAEKIAETLDVVGLITVELFLTKEGYWIVNELAPRPHNSGHYTIDACETSQFDQQVLALCGLPLGNPHQHSDAVMLNLLGDWWFPDASQPAQTPHWEELLQHPNAHLHLYGKEEARPGRKMGHVNFLNTPVDEALKSREQLLKALQH